MTICNRCVSAARWYMVLCAMGIMLWAVQARAQELSLSALPQNLGLSQNFISSIAQDDDGFLWFGTKDGLNRFDGYEFRTFQHEPADSNLLSAAWVHCLASDTAGQLWVGSAGGIDLYKPELDEFCAVRQNKHSGPFSDLGAIYAMVADPDGTIWAYGERSVLYHIGQREKDNLPIVLAAYPHPKAFHDVISNLVADGQGGVWLKDRNGLYRFSLHNQRPVWSRFHWSRFDPSWRALAKVPDRNMPVSGNQDTLIHLAFPASGGGVWLTTSPGFVRISPAGEIQYYPVELTNSDGTGILHFFAGGDGFEYQERLWVGGFEAFGTYDLATQSFNSLQLVETNQRWRESLLSGQTASSGSVGVLALYRDPTDVVWFGTNGYGILRHDIRRPSFEQPPTNRLMSGGSVRCLIPTQDNLVWSYDYTNMFTVTDMATGERYPVDSRSLPAGFLNAEGAFSIRGLVTDDADRIWMASEGGLAVMTRKGRRLTALRTYPIRYGPDFVSTDWAGVYDMRTMPDGSVWFVTTTSLGRLDTTSGAFQEWLFPASTENQVHHSEYPAMHPDPEGGFWVGYRDGLLHFDPTEQRFRQWNNDPQDTSSLGYNLVKSVLPDPDQPERYLWVGTGGGGLNRLDRSTNTFRRWRKSEGLPDDVIYGILPDEKGNLWLSTNQGLVQFGRRRGTTKNFSLRDGLQNQEFNTRAYAKGQDGRLYFGGISGFNGFDPATILSDSFAPPLVFTRLLVNNKALAYGDPGAPLNRTIGHASGLTLHPRDKVVSFEFASLDFRSPGNNQFQYLLEGFDDAWQNIGTQHSITFTNLDPGAYVLRMRGSNSDGIWSKQGASIAIRVLAPWYATRWAYVVYVLSGGLLLGLLYRGNLRRRLQTAETERLAELDRFKTRFFTNITHEFRTPLTVILGMAQQLHATDKTRQVIERNGKQLLGLINQLLDLSRLESGVISVQWETGSIDGFMEYLTESLQTLAVEKEIRLTHYAETRPLHGTFDRQKLQHIVTNLVANAIKFTPANGKVTLHTLQTEQEGQTCLRLKVSDTGKGMSEAALAHVFDRFYREAPEEKEANPSTGIGLALTQELVQALGGTIGVESRLGQGSTFTVTLPISAPTGAFVQPSAEDLAGPVTANEEMRNASTVEEALSRALESQSEVSKAAEVGADSATVLVVEDNQDVIDYIADLLGERYVVLQARDGLAGLALAQEHVPDIVISDVMMPGMDGYGLTKALKGNRLTSHVPVMLLTAKALQEDKMTGLRSGADAYLMKPFDPEELFLRIEGLLRVREAMQKALQASPEGGNKPGREALPESNAPEAVFLQEAHGVVLEHLGQESFGAAELAQGLGMSSMQAYRKFKALTGQTPTLFIRSVRLQEARKRLLDPALTVAEVAYGVGFNQPSYFSRVFKEEFGVAPSDARK